jgi:hypothetical protein
MKKNLIIIHFIDKPAMSIEERKVQLEIKKFEKTKFEQSVLRKLNFASQWEIVKTVVPIGKLLMREIKPEIMYAISTAKNHLEIQKIMKKISPINDRHELSKIFFKQLQQFKRTYYQEQTIATDDEINQFIESMLLNEPSCLIETIANGDQQTSKKNHSKSSQNNSKTNNIKKNNNNKNNNEINNTNNQNHNHNHNHNNTTTDINNQDILKWTHNNSKDRNSKICMSYSIFLYHTKEGNNTELLPIEYTLSSEITRRYPSEWFLNVYFSDTLSNTYISLICEKGIELPHINQRFEFLCGVPIERKAIFLSTKISPNVTAHDLRELLLSTSNNPTLSIDQYNHYLTSLSKPSYTSSKILQLNSNLTYCDSCTHSSSSSLQSPSLQPSQPLQINVELQSHSGLEGGIVKDGSKFEGFGFIPKRVIDNICRELNLDFIPSVIHGSYANSSMVSPFYFRSLLPLTLPFISF